MNDEVSVLGLSTIRRNRGISLEQIAESTKIGVRALEAIERGDFHKLPGGIYNTSYIRQYARAIDYDESDTLSLHDKIGSVETADAAAKRSNGGLLNGYRHASTIVGS